MDQLILRKIVAAVGDSRTLAMLACCCRMLRRLATEEQAERGYCPNLWHLLGTKVPCDTAAQARAAALLNGSFRRQLLLDLVEAQARGVAYDGRLHSYDLVSLPDRGAFLHQVELVAADLQHMLFYSSGLCILAALSFVDQPAGAPGNGSSSRQPRLFSSILCSVLVRAPLRLGMLFQEPPLLVGAADYLQANQLVPVVREQLATLAEAAQWRQRFGPDDDVHILWQSLVRYIPSFAAFAGSLHSCLDSTFVRTVAGRGTLSLRFLDISGSVALSDAAIAMLLGLCPQLRVLHALDSNLGAMSLAALAGRVAQPSEQQEHAKQHRQAGVHTAAANSTAPDAASQVEGALGSLHLEFSRHVAQQPTAAPQSDNGTGATSLQPACQLLGRLAVCGSGRRVKGSALRRALRCLPNLTDLRLHNCEVHAVLHPLLPSVGGATKGDSKNSSKAEAVGHMLGQLSRLEMMSCDDLAPAHAMMLLRRCTSLCRLGLSGKQLAVEQFDRHQHGSLSNVGFDSTSSSSSLAALTHLEVGWGTGGTFLVQAARLAPYLTSLTVRLGAAVSDSQLAAVATSCRRLEQLNLQNANISDDGVVCVLECCPRLTSLQLYNCVGPLSDKLGAACAVRRGKALRLRELHISWGASQLTDEGLAALLHPGVARLQSLVLKGCSQLTDAAWQLVAQHSSSLQCLALEYCGTATAEAKSAAGQHNPMTAAAAAEGLSSCRALLALTVRSCTAAWTKADVEQLCTGCTALQSLCLDA